MIKLSRKNLVIPYALFLALFVVAPLLVILYLSFTDSNGAFTFGNFAKFFGDPTYITTFLYSLAIAVLTTLLCLLLAYPVAYILARSKWNKKMILVLLFVMPMWINFVLRIAALRELLNLLGLVGQSTGFLKTVIGMVYDFLPFMILPLYTTLIKMDKSVLEAASDLGANNMQVFFKAVVPLSLPGIVSGITMVFMPSMTCYVVSDVLSERTFEVLGNLIERNYMDNWNFASAIGIVLLVIIGVVMLFTYRFEDHDVNARGGGLW